MTMIGAKMIKNNPVRISPMIGSPLHGLLLGCYRRHGGTDEGHVADLVDCHVGNFIDEDVTHDVNGDTHGQEPADKAARILDLSRFRADKDLVNDMGAKELCDVVAVNDLDAVDRFISVVLIEEHDAVDLIDIEFSSHQVIDHELGILPVGDDHDVDLVAGLAHPVEDELLPKFPCQELQEEIQKEEGSDKDTRVDLYGLQCEEEQQDSSKLRYVLEKDHIELGKVTSLQYPAVVGEKEDYYQVYEKGVDIELGVVCGRVKIAREPQKVRSDK